MADKKADQEINKKTNKSIMDLIKETKSGNAEALKQEKSEIGKSNAFLGELKKGIELQGGKAEDNKKFQMESKKIQVRELQLQKKNTPFFSESRKQIKRDIKNAKFEERNTTLLGKLTNRLTGNKGAEAEKAKEDAAKDKKQSSLLGKIAGGIGGLLGNVKEKAKSAGKGLFSILKGLAFGGLFIALTKFLQSPMFKKVAEYIANTVVPAVTKFYDKTIKPAFDAVVEFLMNDAFPAISKFLNKTLIPLLKDIYKNIIKPMFDGLKDFAKNSLFPALKEIFKKFGEVYDKIKPSLDKLMKFFKETTLPILFDTLKKQMVIVKDIFMKLADFIGNIVTGDFGAAFDNLKDIGKLVVKAIDNAITGVLKMVGLDFEGNVSDVIGNFFDSIFTDMKNAVNGVIDGIEKLVRSIAGDTIGDLVFGEQTPEEKSLIAEKKKQVELAEKEEKRRNKQLGLLAQKKRINDQIEEEQAKLFRIKEGVTTAKEEFGSFGQFGFERTSAGKLQRLNFEKNRNLNALSQNMPTANDNQQRTDQMMKDQAKLSAFGGAGTTTIINDQSVKTSNQSNSNISTTSFVGNPSPGFKQAAGSNS